ncbi:MAG TPA: SCO family protein [Mycobacteriales bacterium]|nr:SCO family protein [Mycobacteriales bacterium]
MRSLRAGVAAVVLAALLAACGSSSGHAKPASGTYQGLVPTPAIALPTTTLTTTDGAAYPWKSTAAGKATLLYFGYTNCPDVCPTTMADIAAALRKLPSAVQQKVRVVFVTSDPARDTGPVLAKWLSGFAIPATTVGLVGTVTEVDKAGSEAGVPLFPPSKLPDGTIDVEHGAQLIGFTPDGQGRVEWLAAQDQVGLLAKQLEHDLPLLVAGRQ